MTQFHGVGFIIFLFCTSFMLQNQLTTGSGFMQQNGMSNMDHHDQKTANDPTLQQFFNTLELKAGKIMAFYFPMKEPSKRPPPLSKESALAIPFSSTELPNVLNLLSIPESSVTAKRMRNTIRKCEKKAFGGEVKFCATSIESLLDSAQEVFGPQIDIRVSTTKFDRSDNPSYAPILQNYTIAESPREIQASKAMSCHELLYPYKVYYCHLQLTDQKLYKIPLVGENGWKAQALGICHMDTSAWPPTNDAFRVLHTQPGKSPVCHFFSEQVLVLTPSTVDI